MLKLKDVLPANFYTNIDEFSSKVMEEKRFIPFGQLIDSYTRIFKQEDSSKQRTFEIYKVSGLQFFLVSQIMLYQCLQLICQFRSRFWLLFKLFCTFHLYTRPD